MNKIFNLVVCLAFCFTTLFLCSGCSGKKSSDLEKIKEKGVIEIGITNYEPMDYIDSDGETYIGFDADLANLFAEKIGVRARFTLISWNQKIMELNGGYIDLIWNGMTASSELEQNIDLSLKYATNYQCVVVKNNIDLYTSSDSLKNKQIAVEQGSAGDSVVTELSITPNRVNSQLDALSEVVSGSSDCAVIDYTMAYSLVGKGNFSELSIVDSSKIAFNQELFAVGLRKGSDLTEEVNEFLKECYKNGKLSELSSKYNVALNDSELK